MGDSVWRGQMAAQVSRWGRVGGLRLWCTEQCVRVEVGYNGQGGGGVCVSEGETERESVCVCVSISCVVFVRLCCVYFVFL